MATITIEIPDMLKIKAGGISEQVRADSFCAAAHVAFHMKGVQRAIQDHVNSRANAFKTATGRDMSKDEKRKLFDDALDSMQRTGNLPGGTVQDPVQVEAFKLAEAYILNAAKVDSRKAAMDIPKWAKYFDLSEKGYSSPNAKMFNSLLDKRPMLREEAQKIVDARNAAITQTDDEVDLDDDL